MPRKKYRLSSASTEPPQIIRAGSQPRERVSSFWLRQEMRKVLLLVPFLRTTGGCRTKPFAWSEELTFEAEPLPFAGVIGAVRTVMPGPLCAVGTPAADQAIGLEIP